MKRKNRKLGFPAKDSANLFRSLPDVLLDRISEFAGPTRFQSVKSCSEYFFLVKTAIGIVVCEIKDLQAAQDLKNVKEIRITDIGIMPDEAIALRKALEKISTSLKVLHLPGNEIGEDGAIAIGQCLKVNRSLTLLNLWNNKIGDAGAEAIGKVLESNNALQTLNLDVNNIGKDGMKAIAESLKSNKALRTLSLNGNNIGEDGAKSIAKSLESNKALRTLRLCGNEIGDDGAIAIGQGLKVNRSLTLLNLSWNNIGEAGKEAVRNAWGNRRFFLFLRK